MGIRGAAACARAFLYGLSIGAASVYYLDRERGAYRRATFRDGSMRLGRRAIASIDAALRDLAHRARGLEGRARAALFGGSVSDDVLVERVRAQMGRSVSRSHGIEVHAEDGIVRLRGPVLAARVQDLVSRVKSVRGVRGVENELEPHDTADIPALQGGPEPRRRRGSLFRRTSPATRLVAGASGLFLTVRGLRARGPIGSASALFGALLLGGALSETRTRRQRPSETPPAPEPEVVATFVVAETLTFEATPPSSG